MPGISMSRNRSCGWCACSACIASKPSSASAAITSSGQSAASVSRSSARNNGSSSAITAVGAFIGNLQDGARAAIAIRRSSSKRAFSPYSACRRSAMSVDVLARASPGRKATPLSVIAQRAAGRPRPRPRCAIVPPCVAGLQPMGQRVVDQRQQHHRRHARRYSRASGTSISNVEPLAEAHPHDVDVGARQRDLLTAASSSNRADAAAPPAGRRSDHRASAARVTDRAHGARGTWASVLKRNCGSTRACIDCRRDSSVRRRDFARASSAARMRSAASRAVAD